MSNFNCRILVVDDNLAIHDDFRKIFRSTAGGSLEATEAALFGDIAMQMRGTGFQLEFASQGEEALEMVQKALKEGKPYAMGFMDVRMPPGWDGIETISKIWEVDPQMQMAICTAYSDYSLEKIALQLHYSDSFVILKKPFDVIEVKQLAHAFTEKWNLSQRVKQAHAELEKRVAQRTEELAKMQAQLEYLLRSSPAIIYSERLQPEPYITFISDNVSTILGFAPGEFGDPEFWNRQIHPDDAAEAAKGRARLLETGHHPIEYRFRHKDGMYRWIHNDARVIRDITGEPVEIIGSCTDVTPLKEAEQKRQLVETQLRQAQKLEAIGQLAAGIAHEINTPAQYVGDNTRFLKDSFQNIQPILVSHVELLRAAKADSLTPTMIGSADKILAAADLEYLSEQIPAAIKETLEGVDRVTTIVRAMKEFSHPGSKDKTAANLNEAIETTVMVARHEWKYVAEMKLDLDPTLPLIPCFLVEFNQAILNLVVNASHAITDVVKKNPGTKGAILITTRRDNDQVEIRVSDTGTGIPESIRPHIFEPFFTTKEVGKGTGQGLSIVYGSIVKRHGGTVKFESEEGKGTTFILRLPIAPPATETEPRPTEVRRFPGFKTEFSKTLSERT